MIEGDHRATRECIAKCITERVTKYASVARNSSSGNQMVREPVPAIGVKIVVANAVSARGRMDETAATRVYRDVTDLATLLKEQQVANRECTGRNRNAGSRHLSGRARQVDTVLAVHILNKTRAIEAAAWRGSTVTVRHADVLFRGRHNPARRSARRGSADWPVRASRRTGWSRSTGRSIDCGATRKDCRSRPTTTKMESDSNAILDAPHEL